MMRMLTEGDLRLVVRECVRRVLAESFGSHVYSMPPVEQDSEDRVFAALRKAGFSLHEENEGDALIDGMVFLSPSGDKWEITRVYGGTDYEFRRPWDRFWVSVDEGELLGLLSRTGRY